MEIVPPTVDGTPSVSGAGTDAQWSVGETVGVTVTFSEAVDVDTSGGTPSIGIGLGGTAARSATYASGTGTTELVFEYTLVSGDGSHGYMAVTPDSLALNGGTIRSAGSGVDALLAHNGALTSGNSGRSTGPEVRFEDVPKSHDGATAFTVVVQFSGQPAGLSATRDAASVLEVTGGSVTGARVTSKSANLAWEVTVAPDGLGEVTIEVPVRACTEANAVCIGGRSLSRAVETTVPGTRMTARFTQTPSAHDGSNGFELHMEFSHEPENFSYRTVQGALFDIEGGRIERVWRRERGKGRQWGIVVAPDGGGAVTLAARATTDCAAQNAVCDAEGWKFAGDLSLTVPGPASSSLPVVSIAASATSVTEGTAAAFTLSRTGATDAALTVSVSASVSGTPPTSVTFAAASASATLSVATEDDEVAEDASTVTAKVSSGSGYTVSGTSGSADVVVEDDDAAPVVTTASPIVVAENATAVATLSATDADTAAEDLSWSIPAGADGGADRAKFALTTAGVLTFKAAKDYESPDDTDTDGDYEITVRVTDGVNPVDAALVVRLSAVDDTGPTASFEALPERHDGAAAFRFELHFSETPSGLSYRTVGGGLLEVTGGTLTHARRLTRGRNQGWEVTVVPTQAGDIVITLPARSCGEADAICIDGEPLARAATATVPGPASSSLPVVSIAASATSVTEGAAAAFTLARTGATAAELTVAVTVSENEAAVSGTPPASVTFAAGSASATLSVATEDDEAAEDASTVTATVSSGSGYTVDRTSGSAEAVVNDDDAAPAVATASPVVVAENATAVATLTATDADTAAADLAWSIPAGAAGGADGAKFALTADGALSFKAAKDFEAPDDADGDGDYEVTVRVTDGANPVDAALVVRLSDVDDTAPVLSSASVNGAALTLTFSEALDGDSAPPASSFAVTVGGTARTVDAVAVSGKAVTLTLSSAVTSGQTVTVGYTVPTGAGAKPVQDAAGNPPASFANTNATNATDALPVVSIAPAATPVTEGAAAAFTLARTGATAAELTVAVSVSESEAAVSGTPPASVTFAAGSASATLSVPTVDDEAAEDASTVTATVSSGSGYTVDGTSGSAELVVNDDDAAPVVATASPVVVAENATAVTTLTATDADTAAADLAWSIPAGAAGGADGAKFALTADGALSFKAAKDFEAPDDADGDGDYEVTVRVTDGANPVDAALVVRLSDVDDTAPTLSSASVNGAALTLTFSEALDTASQPPASSFAVTVGGTARTVDAVAVSGKAVTLTLSSAVTSGQTVTVGYTVPTGAGAKPVQDAAGNPPASFANTEAKNLTAAALPAVWIVAVSTPVTEGTAAAFVLRRTGATDDALTVTVSVSEAGSVLNGAPPSSATFAAGSAEARLSVATANDAVDEADARVRASIVAGDGYEVDGESASAGVDVFDDDAAPQAAAVELWSTTMTWNDLGNNWFGGFADAFSNPGWSEDGQDFRIWFISYEAGARQLSMTHDGSGGQIAAPEQLTLHVGGLTVGPGEALSDFARAARGEVGGIDNAWRAGEQVSVRLTRTAGDSGAAPGGPGFSVADAQANEASGVPLRFRVTLDAPAQSTVSVRYRTANGTAVAGQDYVAAHGALRFAPGETAKTVEVRMLQDDHDEGSETMTLTLSNASGATVADGTATGTISNTGPIPQAWIARFGRTVADQVLEAVEGRMRAGRQPGTEVSLAGERIGLGPLFGAGGDAPASGDATSGATRAREAEAPRAAGALADWLKGGTGPEGQGFGLGTGSTDRERTMGDRELLLGSSFAVTEETAGKGFVSLWGRGSVTRFDGREGTLSLDGEVASAMLGTDWSQGRWTTGLLVSHSLGEGGYRDGSGTGGAGNGTISATLTGLYPWLRHALSERLEAWGAAGYGEGSLTLEPGDGPPIRTDLDLWMAAAGLRGVVLDGGNEGLTLRAKTDAMIVQTSTDAVSGSGTGGGNLAAAEAEVTRLRLGLEGALPVRLADSSVLTPGFEIGVRHDGGDAETGYGADIGANLAWTDARRGLSAELRGRGLLSHEAKGFRERGLSGSFSWDPVAGERGPRLSLTQTVGGAPSGGAEALLGRGTLEGLAANDNGGGSRAGDDLKSRRLELKFGYGFAAFGDRFTWTPEAGVGLSETGRDYSLGWRLLRGGAGAPDGGAFELSFGARRHENDNDDTRPEHEVGLRLTARW